MFLGATYIVGVQSRYKEILAKWLNHKDHKVHKDDI